MTVEHATSVHAGQRQVRMGPTTESRDLAQSSTSMRPRDYDTPTSPSRTITTVQEEESTLSNSASPLLSEEALRAHDELVPPDPGVHGGVSPTSSAADTHSSPRGTRRASYKGSQISAATNPLDDPVTDRNLDKMIKASSFRIDPNEMTEPTVRWSALSRCSHAHIIEQTQGSAQAPAKRKEHETVPPQPKVLSTDALQKHYKTTAGYVARRETRLLERLRQSDADNGTATNPAVWVSIHESWQVSVCIVPQNASARFKALTSKDRRQSCLSRAVLGLSFRVFGALLVLCLIQAGNYWLSMNFTAEMSDEATVLNYAGRRRMLTLRTLVLSREVLLNDGKYGYSGLVEVALTGFALSVLISALLLQ